MVMTYVHALVRRDVFFPSVHAGRSFRVRNAQWGQESEERSDAFSLPERQDAREFPKKHSTPLGSSDLKKNQQNAAQGWHHYHDKDIYPIWQTPGFFRFERLRFLNALGVLTTDHTALHQASAKSTRFTAILKIADIRDYLKAVNVKVVTCQTNLGVGQLMMTL